MRLVRAALLAHNSLPCCSTQVITNDAAAYCLPVNLNHAQNSSPILPYDGTGVKEKIKKSYFYTTVFRGGLYLPSLSSGRVENVSFTLPLFEDMYPL